VPVINEAVTGTLSDWVEIKMRPGGTDSMDVSGLYVTMYYGTNENLAEEPVTLYSKDKTDTPYDDTIILVHLCEPEIPDENDRTGDTNGNGVIDVYCGNYYASLWNSDCVVAIDTDDDPSNGGIIDFIAFSNMDLSPNSTIFRYIRSAIENGAWKSASDDIQQSCINIGEEGLSSYMSISRKDSEDTDSLSDFSIVRFQTPGQENIINADPKGRSLFRLLRKNISIVPHSSRLDKGNIPLFVYEICRLKLRIFSVTGLMIYESPLTGPVNPGNFSLSWGPDLRKRELTTGLYIGRIEATAAEGRVCETGSVYFILKNR